MFPHAYQIQVQQSVEHGYIFNQRRLPHPDQHVNVDNLALEFLIKPDAESIQDPESGVVMKSGTALEVAYEYVINDLSIKNSDSLTHDKAEFTWQSLLGQRLENKFAAKWQQEQEQKIGTAQP